MKNLPTEPTQVIEPDDGADAVAGGATTPERPSRRQGLQVVPKAKRRRYSAEYKAKILAEADACAGKPGKLGELLRREGLYSSHLVDWRRARDAGALAALSKKRGPKPKRTPEQIENERLRRENERLAERLRKAEIIIDVQKKLHALLGIPLPAVPSLEDET